jgi:hypothetical protein
MNVQVAHDSAARGMGGILVGVAMGMIARALEMPNWQVGVVAVLIGVGLPLAISGRWKNW